MLIELITLNQLKKRNHNFTTDKNLMSKKKRENQNIDGKVILVFKNNPRKRYNHKQIAFKLEIKDTMGSNAIVQALSKLVSQKIIKQSSPGKYGLNDDNKQYIKGTIEITASGNGYLILPEGENDRTRDSLRNHVFDDFLWWKIYQNTCRRICDDQRIQPGERDVHLVLPPSPFSFCCPESNSYVILHT